VTTIHLPAVETWAVDDLAHLPETLSYEIHNGDLVIRSPAKLWHQRVARRICNYLGSRGLVADMDVGVLRTQSDTRVPDVAVFLDEPDPDTAWHEASSLSLVVEVWSPSSHKKDHEAMQWYADRGIAEYWLAERIEGDSWGAAVTRYALARTASGDAAYIKTDVTTLEAFERG
jgi:Uma2 family endonuclease